ncbi:LLM class flavin-dependent oxidoreductase [Amycolatopsis sp. lyj-90]|uniref:LLM class flavin-dependent oxidoreductase n=1 Tax=Amycolatopsis sp. lyj-90 TaxID=2789285 RepID=UPI00397CD738
MKLGVNVSYRDAGVLGREAERLGYDLVVVPEGFRADAATVLGVVAGSTERIALASGVFQIPGRTPAMTALTAATLNALSHGRFRLGLGVSNPDISEGWHGVPFAAPLGRTREYVEIVRRTLDGERVTYQGAHFRLPPPGCAAMPLALFATHSEIRMPIYLAAVGPRSLELAGEIADGWLGAFCAPGQLKEILTRIGAGRERIGAGLDGFEVLSGVPAVAGSDPVAAAEPLRGYFAHFMGMGDPGRNVYLKLMALMGYGAEAAAVHERMVAGDARTAAAAVPAGFIEQVSLTGPEDRIADRMLEYAESGLTTMVVSPFAETTAGRIEILGAVAEARRRAGLS